MQLEPQPVTFRVFEIVCLADEASEMHNALCQIIEFYRNKISKREREAIVLSMTHRYGPNPDEPTI